MSENVILQKINRSSLGGRQARALRASIPVARARQAIDVALEKERRRQLGGTGPGPTKR